MKRNLIISLLFLVSVLFFISSCKNGQEIHEHNYSYESDLHDHWQNCQECGEITVKEPHIWNDGVITKSPSEKEFGEKTFTCTVCEYGKKVQLEKLKPSVYKIIYELNGGHFTEERYPQSYTCGTETTLLTPVKENYTFVGWKKTNNITSDTVTEVGNQNETGDLKVYAMWSYNLEFMNLNYVDDKRDIAYIQMSKNNEENLDEVFILAAINAGFDNLQTVKCKDYTKNLNANIGANVEYMYNLVLELEGSYDLAVISRQDFTWYCSWKKNDGYYSIKTYSYDELIQRLIQEKDYYKEAVSFEIKNTIKPTWMHYVWASGSDLVFYAQVYFEGGIYPKNVDIYVCLYNADDPYSDPQSFLLTINPEFNNTYANDIIEYGATLDGFDIFNGEYYTFIRLDVNGKSYVAPTDKTSSILELDGKIPDSSCYPKYIWPITVSK